MAVFCKSRDINQKDNFCEFKTISNSHTPNNNQCHKHIKSEDYIEADKNAMELDGFTNLLENDLNVNLTYKPRLGEHEFKGRENLIELKLNTHNLKANSRKMNVYVELVVKFIKILSRFTFTFVFINSYRYHHNYLNNITYDNHCVTQYFRRIDIRRLIQRKPNLLPLKNHEKETVNYPFKFFVSAYQKPSIKINIFINIILIIVVLASFITDYLLVDFMSIINKYAIVNYSYKSYSKVIFKVKGAGTIAKTLRSVFNEYNKEEKLDIAENSQKCLPNVYKIDEALLKSTALQIGLLIVSIILEVYIKRANRYICAYYYRKREKERVLWLYNHLLIKRLSFLANAKRTILLRLKTSTLDLDDGFTTYFFTEIEPLRKLLSLFGIGGASCILCSHPRRKSSIMCPSCKILYCIECWNDLDEQCVVCLTDFDEPINENVSLDVRLSKLRLSQQI